MFFLYLYGFQIFKDQCGSVPFIAVAVLVVGDFFLFWMIISVFFFETFLRSDTVQVFMFKLEIIHAHFEFQVSTAESVKMLTYSRLEIVFKDVSEGIHNVMCAQSTVVRFDDILSSKAS